MTTPRLTRYAAIYARVSTEDQGKGFSIPTQIEACQKLAEREGYTVPEAYVLVDEGISGTTMDRPSLRKLRDLVHAHTISAVIVYDPDRLSRNLGHQLLFTEEFEQAHVKLLIVSHPLEQGPEGWLFFQMRGALAEYERAKILERMRRGKIGRAKAGHPGGGVPLGYRYISGPHGGRYEIDDEEASIVRRIFAMCLEGITPHSIAKRLTEDRVPTHRDRHPSKSRKLLGSGVWNISSVHHILRNEAYIGRFYWNKYRCLGHNKRVLRDRSEWIPIPAIIDDATFQAAHAQIARNKALSPRRRIHEYLFLGGRLRCGTCGRAMTGHSTRGTYRRYRCVTQTWSVDASHVCRGGLHGDQIEAQVWDAIEQVLNDPDRIAAEIMRQQGDASAQQVAATRELSLIQRALAKCAREAQRWEQAYAAEAINLEEFKSHKQELAMRRKSLLAEQEAIQGRLTQAQQVSLRAESLREYCARVKAKLQTFDMAEKRLALEALDIRVTWSIEQPLRIQGTIPMMPLVPTHCQSISGSTHRLDPVPGPHVSLLDNPYRGYAGAVR